MRGCRESQASGSSRLWASSCSGVSRSSFPGTGAERPLRHARLRLRHALFPYATMLYEHDLVAVALLGALLLAMNPASPRGCSVRDSAPEQQSSRATSRFSLRQPSAPTSSGGRAGSAGVLAFAAGTLPPSAFSRPTISSAWNWWRRRTMPGRTRCSSTEGGSGLFAAPRWDVFAALLISPYRGLFFGTPVLVLGVIGLVVMLRRTDLRPEGLLCAAMFAPRVRLQPVIHGVERRLGCGSRYLIPALPFLALPIVFVPLRAAWVRHALLAVSILAMSLATVV